MEIEIDCPDCGYNYYSAAEKTTRKLAYLTIGKCTAGECELTIEFPEGSTEEQTYPDLQDLRAFVHSSFELLSKEDCGCSN
jgi:hypothetical protein